MTFQPYSKSVNVSKELSKTSLLSLLRLTKILLGVVLAGKFSLRLYHKVLLLKFHDLFTSPFSFKTICTGRFQIKTANPCVFIFMNKSVNKYHLSSMVTPVEYGGYYKILFICGHVGGSV